MTLTDNLAAFYWTNDVTLTNLWHWLIMWRWPIMWHALIGLKYWYGFDWWCGGILFEQNADVVLIDDVFQPVKICHVTQSWASELFSSDGLDLPIVSIIRGLLLLIWRPSIHFLVSFSIILSPACVFLHIVIKLPFYPLFNYECLFSFKLGLKVKNQHDRWA